MNQKTYEGTVRFGFATNTYDAEGAHLRRRTDISPLRPSRCWRRSGARSSRCPRCLGQENQRPPSPRARPQEHPR